MSTDSGPGRPTGLPAGVELEVFDGSAGRIEDLRRLAENAFAEDQPPPKWAVESARFETGRGLLAVDDGQVVGSNIVYSLSTSVPGPVPAGPVAGADAPPTREVPTAGISFVCVLPSHRRRGITSVLMRRVLTDLHDRGAEPVAVLWASEATIYGRFGYGSATRAARFGLPRRAGVVRADLADPLNPRLVDPATSIEQVEQLAAAVRAVRPGMPARPAHWLPGSVADDPAVRHGTGPLRCVLLSSGDRVRAAARYAVRPVGDWPRATELVVSEAYSDGPLSHAALYRWLTELDLITRVVSPLRPVDDPVLDQLTDSRSAETVQHDALWVRLVDLDRALPARGYASDISAVLAVTDRDCPWNAGRWRMQVSGGEATLTRTDDSPDLELDVSVLGAAYLGSAGTLARLGRAGLVSVRKPGVLDRLSRSFESAVQPWAPWVF
jgi:predicted N-acetyltransferase YhbS